MGQYDYLSTEQLITECERRGIVCTPSVCKKPLLLIRRLQDYDDAKTRHYVQVEEREAVNIARVPGQMVLIGSCSFVSVPHDIVTLKILPHLSPHEVFQLAQTCKYLYTDCIAWLRAEAIREFGPQGTPIMFDFMWKRQGDSATMIFFPLVVSLITQQGKRTFEQVSQENRLKLIAKNSTQRDYNVLKAEVMIRLDRVNREFRREFKFSSLRTVNLGWTVYKLGKHNSPLLDTQTKAWCKYILTGQPEPDWKLTKKKRERN